MLIKVNLSTSASKKQINSAKILFGSKGESIIKALEEASKSKFLATEQIDNLLAWLKQADEEAVQKYAGSAVGKKIVAPAKAYAANKSFDGKLKALAAIKFKAPTARGPKAGADIGSVEKVGAKPSTKKKPEHETDLAPLFTAHDMGTDPSHPAVRKAFKQVFGVTSGAQGTGSIGSSNMDEGVYFERTKSKASTYLLYEVTSDLARELGLPASSKYVVYTDSYMQEGPFDGNVDPVNKPKAFAQYKSAKAEFIKQIKTIK